MSVTHQDVSDYIKDYYISDIYCEMVDDKLIINTYAEFEGFGFSTLPGDIIFERTCDLGYSEITTVPDNIVLKGDLLVNNTHITTLPILNIGRQLHMRNTNIVLSDFTYIGSYIGSDNSKYAHLDSLTINGYIFSTGILS